MLGRRAVGFTVTRRCSGSGTFAPSSAFTPEKIMGEVNVKKTIEKLRAMKPIKMRSAQPTRKAAVLIPICVVDGRVSLLYTLRTSHLSTHKGQVSFPGGRQDKGEFLEDTAIRETREELGIEDKDIKIWGSANAMVAKDTYILPVVGEIMHEIDVEHPGINRNEVEEVFTVPIEVLCDKNQNGYTQFANYSTPVYLGGQRRIWGITALLTHMFLLCFVPQNAYKNPVKFVPRIQVSKRN